MNMEFYGIFLATEIADSCHKIFYQDSSLAHEQYSDDLNRTLDHVFERCHKEANNLLEYCDSFRMVSDIEMSFCAMQYAPQALFPSCVLQNYTRASNSHERTPSLVHQLYNEYVSCGDNQKNHVYKYENVLRSIGLSIPSFDGSSFSYDIHMLPCSFDLLAYRLSLSIHPDKYHAEILGASLFELVVGYPSVFSSFFESNSSVRHFVECHIKSRHQKHDLLRQIMQEVLSVCDVDQVCSVIQRIFCGFMTSLYLYRHWWKHVVDYAQYGSADSHEDMVRLVKNKSKYAVGYHQRLKLSKHHFDDLIVKDPELFVKYLARSPWVKPGHPEKSMLLGTLIDFEGPMFRIFSEDELGVIHRWIASLSPDLAGSPDILKDQRIKDHLGLSLIFHHVNTIKPPSEGQKKYLRARQSRTLYHRLLNIEQYPLIYSEALDFCERWLARSARRICQSNHALPFQSYSHKALNEWFEHKALDQAKSYSKNIDVQKSREDVINEAVQLCPMIFIDGAWIQKWSNISLLSSPMGGLLYRIFSDEIGNGDPRLNHPNIYRSLMESMGIQLPDFRTIEFAQDHRFSDASFSIPAFWLSLSLFPHRFIPETLGLNLAMELSGVGGAYRTARDELSHYGFSTLFVDLHNTIDNVSSGHSAMAVRAIEIYMSSLTQINDSLCLEDHWKRIWIGYQSLDLPDFHWTDYFRRQLRYPFSSSKRRL